MVVKGQAKKVGKRIDIRPAVLWLDMDMSHRGVQF
jgi:hypothetical protein